MRPRRRSTRTAPTAPPRTPPRAPTVTPRRPPTPKGLQDRSDTGQAANHPSFYEHHGEAVPNEGRLAA